MATSTAAVASFYLRNNVNITSDYPVNSQSSRKQRSSRMILKVKASSETQTATSRRQRRPQNVDGEFFVDHTCIDCDTCRWMAPDIFTRVDGMSAVFKQPSSGKERKEALQALLSCPTSSIHTEIPPRDMLEVQKTFPIPINEERLPGVYHCGYHSEKSYGASSYLIVRPEGNILIDSPRYTERLAENIKKMGGARYMFLTHQDDVADHEKWSDQLGCERILHLQDVNLSTANVEVRLEGTGPWCLDDDITLIHTPGHSEGSVSLFYKSKKVLFTGDHLLMDEFGLTIMEKYNWFSVSTQLDSVRNLLEWDFEWILPGHGRRVQFQSREEKNRVLEAFLAAKAQET
ncbi:hypothetical protein M9H77_09238 [Catharanthus roseus]|uniref:Uncharacterized protein n=1 Tax=Catharanthus roseus TaxID=4058 RepID=A0ACC0C0F4_CATRO|nr:hypothetical protein M9H77_09238 [Catharanthus roseus]